MAIGVLEEFHRAVSICGGEDISVGVIDAVYTIFDVDGDGHLSTEEFISIMKSRLKRGLRVNDCPILVSLLVILVSLSLLPRLQSHLVKDEHGWEKFKNCVRHEMRLKRGGM